MTKSSFSSRVTSSLMMLMASSAVAQQSPTLAPTFTLAPSTLQPTAFSTTWLGCYDLSVEDGQTAKIVVGEPTIVCFHIAGGQTRNWADGVAYIRRSFTPEADEFSRFHIPNSYRDLVQRSETDDLPKNPDFSLHKTIGAAAQTRVSFLRDYYDFDSKRVFPYLTAVIDVKDGVVRGITWDEACIFCGPDQCVENTRGYDGDLKNADVIGYTKGCYIEKTECDRKYTQNPDETLCDITVYVVWSGTDANGISLQSAANRFSMFPVQELQDQLSQIQDF